MRRLRTCALLTLLVSFAASRPADASGRDGQHDFDFAIGTFKSRVRRLQHPLTGSTTWIEGNGTVSVRKLRNGRGQVEEIEVDLPSGHLEGLTLRLYDPASREWSLYWANAAQGVLARPPTVGAFDHGRGEFYDQEAYDGRTILVRQVFSEVARDSYHFEQAFSIDGGKTWEPNWIADVERTGAGPAAPTPLDAADRNRDFDFELGRWKTHVSRLRAPLSGSKSWVEYDGTSEVTPVWHGRASLLELHVQGAAGTIEGIGLRLFDPHAHTWSLNWASGRSAEVGAPAIGQFNDGRGEFVSVEPFEGKQIFVRNVFTEMKPDSSRFEQAFSTDGGRTWETNWVMTFAAAKAAKSAEAAPHVD